jgi:hypothetical protein
MANDSTPSARILAFRLTSREAERRVRKVAQKSGRVLFDVDATKEMVERDTTDAQCLEVLRAGSADGDPVETETGEWQCTMKKSLKGGRVLGVVVVLLRSQRLYVKKLEVVGRL